MADNGYHIPIMLSECMESLITDKNGIYLDGTLGGGGHSYEILKRTSPNGRLIGIDRDIEAIQYASNRLKEFGDRVTIVHSNFKDATQVLDNLKIEYIDGILLDLGISSKQIDDGERGFSYIKDAPLDMRMNREQKLTAYEVVNTYKEDKLLKILWEYGEENFARKIVSNIIAQRAKKPIETTLELAEIIKKSVPLYAQKHGHPAKKTFQAIRIEVNAELEGLKEAVYNLIMRLKKGGRIVIITFHSLEDRIIKQLFKTEATDCICDKNILICQCGHKAKLRLINNKPIAATDKEIEMNSRAASAKMRAAERI